jgi:hypothetical protein
LRPGAELPWRRPRHELLLLALVALAALSLVNPVDVQDVSRICLTRALVHDQITVDSCVGEIVDRSSYGGHLYTNTAPGMSALEIPAVEAVRLPAAQRWAPDGDLKLWVVRLLSSGIGFLVCAFLVGRLSEALAPGFGGVALVAFALGTLMAPLAVENFDQVPAAVLGFAAFVLAGRRRPLLAGLAAGAALTVEYQAVAILIVVGTYVALRGAGSLLRYGAGAAPGIVLLGAYDWAAFGAPWHDPLRYADNGFRAESHAGLLGVHLPTADGAWHVFLGDRGLLITSPILLAAALGLVLLWRRGYRAEAAVCAVVAAVFVAADCGYFDPYGGISPGPRYLVPALPFLAVGLAPVFAWRRLLTTVLAAASILATAGVTLSWASGVTYKHTVWRELLPFPAQLGSSRVVDYLEQTVFAWLGASRTTAALLIGLFALSALAVAVANTRR